MLNNKLDLRLPDYDFNEAIEEQLDQRSESYEPNHLVKSLKNSSQLKLVPSFNSEDSATNIYVRSKSSFGVIIFAN